MNQSINQTNYEMPEISFHNSFSTQNQQQLIVSKTIQTVKTKQKNSKSEKESPKLSSLAEALRNRVRKQKINRQMDKMPHIVNDPIINIIK